MIRELLNTLYVQTQGSYLRLRNHNVVIEADDEEDFEIPLHHLGGITIFGNVLLSPFLIHDCAEEGRDVVWFSRGGRFKGRLISPTTGNVLLRRAQHTHLTDDDSPLNLAKSFVRGKINNQRYVLQRALRDGIDDPEPVEVGVEELERNLNRLPETRSLEQVRGVEGNASSTYFGLFDSLILADDPTFIFIERSRRPPEDAINALLSFAYTLLTRDCEAALEGVGLDPQVGYLHALRPGRPALALDLVEEFRPIIADRAVLTLINRRQVNADDFEERPGGAVHLTDEGRSTFLEHWLDRKKRKRSHPVLKKKTEEGLLPHLQARLLARCLRQDIDEYPPFTNR